METRRGNRKVIRVAAGVVALFVLGGGCSAIRSSDGSGSQAMVAKSAGTASAGSGGASVADSLAAPAPATATGSALPASVGAPRIVKTATLRLEVKRGDFSRAFSEVATIASSAGGFVASSNSSAASEHDVSAGSLTLRVPADQFDGVRRDVRKLGSLTSEEIKGDDVGGQLADLDARLRNLGSQEEAIRGLMARSKDVPETLQVQNQLSAVREQIEQLTAQQARLTDAVTFATLTVDLAEPGAVAVDDEPSALRDAISQAWEGMQAVVAGVIIVVGYALPLLLLVLAGVGSWRVASRRRPVPAA